MTPNSADSARRTLGLGLCFSGVFLIACVLWGRRADASEDGASVYNLGTGGPEAAIMPPLEGVYLESELYYVHAVDRASRELPEAGEIAAGVHQFSPTGAVTVLWQPSTNVLGGAFDVGGELIAGVPSVHAAAVLRGPSGGQLTASTRDTAFIFGDPTAKSDLGWKWGDFHLKASLEINIPAGQYRVDQLANLSYHRWAQDASLAQTWHDDKTGWDVSAKAGLTFNGENPSTHYATGTEFHVEGSLAKALSSAVSVGVQAYRFEQITGNSGAGATLGPFKGRATGVGGVATSNFNIGETPASLRFWGMTEFGVMNRPVSTIFELDLTVPLSMKPSAAGP